MTIVLNNGDKIENVSNIEFLKAGSKVSALLEDYETVTIFTYDIDYIEGEDK